MRLLLCALILLTGVAVAQQELVPPPAVTDPRQITSKKNPDLQSFTIEQLYMTRAVGDSAWSPDGKQVAFVSNMSGRNNIWIMPAEGGFPVQLTISDQRQISPAWSPDGKWIAYASDYNGDEQWDLFLVSPANGAVINLTKTPYVAEMGPAWSPDGRWLAYVVKPRTSSTFEIDAINVLTRAIKHLTTGTPRQFGNYSPIWSRDGKWIAATQLRADEKDANVVVVEVATGKATNVTPHTGDQTFTATDWSPDGKKLLLTSNAANGYDNVGLLDIATKQIQWLTRDQWEIRAGGFSPDGKLLTWTANVDGNTDIYLYDLAAQKAEPLPLPKGVNAPAGAESAFSRDGSHLLFSHDGPTSPNDLWVYSLAERHFHPITKSLVGGLRSADMVEPVLVHYPSRDGKFQISAFVYAPYNQQRDRRRPAIVYIHGGPISQSVNDFERRIQYLVNQGYFVIAPNYRGSSGFGKAFTNANQMDAGGGELNDLLDAAEWMKRSEYIDPKKLVVMGPSYGGYLTMMAVTKAPDMWAAAVPIVPFVNWFTEIENEDPILRESDLATMGDPVKNKALWEDRSPINFVDRIKAPLLILAGGNDPRCPNSEAKQIYDALKKRGSVVELKIYENEGHGFARVENQIDAYKRVAAFLREHVPAPGCGCSVYE
jgi:dipeptidyl aminopeptidase/acylaminoacyl peptidase